MIPPQPEWSESHRPPAFCRECECVTNHTTKEHQDAAARVERNEWPSDVEDGGEA
jgi:hypothetical protein